MNSKRCAGVHTHALITTPPKRLLINRFSSQGPYLLFSPTPNGSLLKGELEIITDTSVVQTDISWRAAWPFQVLKEQTVPILKPGPLNLGGGDVTAADLQTLIRWLFLGTRTDQLCLFSCVLIRTRRITSWSNCWILQTRETCLKLSQFVINVRNL